ncbi:putative F-box protein At3g21120 [Lycium barbarum]|uniref:putative F-box protein At3g21120 n=1 Tax=Lycium barbarum TaxID=112863 RepID=UPI00293E265D|nr:putative F-box protein At3g21120 [Lycium barbarum]
MQFSMTTKRKKKQHVISIPKEVVVEILRRVPCQDLCETLKKVCMHWCSIIYSGSFAYSQIERGISKSSSSFSQLEAVVVTRADDRRCVTISALEWHSIPNYPFDEQEYWKTKYMFTKNDVFMDTLEPEIYMARAGSVNGFVCFWSSDARLHVSNPITKEYFTTPPYTTDIGSLYYIRRPALLGFGFCHLSYEYKVVVLENAGLLDGEIKPLVLTVGTDRSWRSLKAIPDRKFVAQFQIFGGVHVKGVLYWYMETCTLTEWLDNHANDRLKTLICFDVTKEDLVMIVVPIENLEEKYVSISIAEKGGKLCLININYGPICSLLIELYIARNDIDDDLSSLNSWKKELTVTVPNMAYGMGVRHLFVLIVTDEIMVIRLNHDATYGFFDVATGMLLGVHSLVRCATLVPFVPSLVSLFHRPPLFPLLNSSVRC